MRREKWFVVTNQLVSKISFGWVFSLKSSEGSLWVTLTTAEACTVVLSKPIHDIKNKNSLCFLFQDKALLETTDQISEVKSIFKTLENALHAAKSADIGRSREQPDLKLTLNDFMCHVNTLKGKCFCWAPNLV